MHGTTSRPNFAAGRCWPSGTPGPQAFAIRVHVRIDTFTKGRRGRAKFLHYFPAGFYDPTYVEWERAYKWSAHRRWQHALDPASFGSLLKSGKHREIAATALAIEGRTNLLFSFEKMALRDGVKSRAGAAAFAGGLFDFLHGSAEPGVRFEQWCETLARLPRRQTRVLTWPAATVFGFIAQPATHFLLKPNVTRIAAEHYGLPLEYRSAPSWPVYRGVLNLARTVRRDLSDLHPRDMIDIQSFLWVQGSDEYPA